MSKSANSAPGWVRRWATPTEDAHPRRTERSAEWQAGVDMRGGNGARAGGHRHGRPVARLGERMLSPRRCKWRWQRQVHNLRCTCGGTCARSQPSCSHGVTTQWQCVHVCVLSHKLYTYAAHMCAPARGAVRKDVDDCHGRSSTRFFRFASFALAHQLACTIVHRDASPVLLPAKVRA